MKPDYVDYPILYDKAIVPAWNNPHAIPKDIKHKVGIIMQILRLAGVL